MSEPEHATVPYKGYILNASAMPLAAGGFSPGLFIGQDLASGYNETKLSLKQGSFETAEEAIDFAIRAGAVWVEEQTN